MVNTLVTFDRGVVDANVVADTNGISQIVEGIPKYIKGYHGGAAVRAGDPAGVTNHRFRVPLGVLGNHYGSIYMKNNTAHGSPTASVNFFYIQTTDNSYLAYFRVRPDNALSIRLNDGTEVRTGTAGDIPVGSWFRLDWQVTGTTVNWRVHYDPDGTTPDLSGSVDASIIATQADKVTMGVQSNDATIIRDWSFDTVRASNSAATWLPPYSAPVVRAKWSGNGLSTPQDMDTTTAGPNDTTFGFVSDGISIIDGGIQSPRIQLAQILGSNCYISWGQSRLVNPVNEGAARIYAEFTGYGANAFSIFTATNESGTTVWRVDVKENDGLLRLRDSSSLLAESTWALPLNTLLRIEVIFSTDLFGLYIFENDNPEPWNQLEISPLGTPVLRSLRFGNNAGGYTIPTWYLDELVLIDAPTFIGPLAPPEEPTPATIWDGTQEVPGTVTLWDGTQEVPITLEVI